ncbi:hypothetical protein Ahy_B10g101699 [Arachis hypogaea]|uniref:Zinc finger PMZ-type domain-containing protein n=1 Tax=Arachis hypogaea TaxID=3818 RepID=A0A444X054_ARAHY|nr:hypothetical protein Ahy_B10g101699 [Arachis hypogaea]
MSDDEDVDAEPVDIPEEEDEELNNFRMSQVTLIQPAISKPYDHPAYYSTLNLDAMNVDCSFDQGGPENDPTHELGPDVNGTYASHIIENKRNGRLGDTADPKISIRVLQGAFENYFGYKASYRKVWLAKRRVIAKTCVEELAAVPRSRQHNYQVLLDEGKCDYGYFQALHLPCRYVLAACSHARLDWRDHVHPMYRIETIFKVYNMEFRLIGHEDDWPSYDGPRI